MKSLNGSMVINQELKDKVLMKEVHFGKMKKIVKEQPIRCPHCNQRLLDAEYVVGTIKCPRCKIP